MGGKFDFTIKIMHLVASGSVLSEPPFYFVSIIDRDVVCSLTKRDLDIVLDAY